MEGRFNPDLPESLQVAFEKAMNFEPCILTKQTINTRRMNEVNQIDITNYDEVLRSMKPTYGILIIKVKIIILTIKIKTETMVITIIPATAPAI